VTRDRLKWTFRDDELRAQLERAEREAEPDPTTRTLERADFDVVFQPIVDLRTRQVFAHESLVRCKATAFKNPLTLFDAAVKERTCGRIGRLIREVAFERGSGLPLFVNIHPEELASRWLVRPDDPLNYHDADVFLEITESTAFEYFDLCRSVLKEVCARSSAYLVVDDLGAGHSNLKRVLDLEPAVVKLDRELVSGIERNKRQQLLVRSVVSMCHDLGALVVAEGIETAAELAAVVASGADYGQGYLLARPAFPSPSISWPT
jgi:EAL domain-containing protein (putative c-di-GMP-specific phosphodiesterase class I)